MKLYLIAYITSNDGVLTRKIWAETQKSAIEKFYLENCVDEIIAVTELEK